jgi:hypothetical protein
MATMYDVTRDGRFVGLIPAGQAASNLVLAQQVQVVLNWFEELRSRVPN